MLQHSLKAFKPIVPQEYAESKHWGILQPGLWPKQGSYP